jgi:hypothetical protein
MQKEAAMTEFENSPGIFLDTTHRTAGHWADLKPTLAEHKQILST